ncbi:hypothetical protein GBF38_001666 [Nibea albiflora]|uniref:Uncharacterized protein n=1 Tax=Nibea albiflora TaxID=240163 RepID=A0ACB7EU03_NIBAL|nr:hypothetical protein GBF38_001666 [Nibea albiflora]
MELHQVDCGNGVERGLGPPNILLPLLQPTCPSPGMAKSEGNPPPPPPPPPSSLSCVDLWLGAAMRGDLWPIVIYVVVGLGCAGRGPVEGRRWIQGVTEGDNLITAFYPPFIFIFDTRRFARSFPPPARPPAHPPTSCRYGNLKPGKKPSARNDLMVSAETDTC